MQNNSLFAATPAWDLMVSLASSEHPQTISTCSSSLDQVMGGGFPLGYVTEIAGGGGCGKTQICFQSCVNVQLPVSVGGIEGEALYLDSECTFVPSRIADMAKSLCGHFGFASSLFNSDTVLSRIYYHQILDPAQLLSVITSLDQTLKSKPRVKLIVVDSIAAPLRHEFEDYSYRSEYLAHIGGLLTRLAARHGIAVIVTNQMTSKLSSQEGNSSLEIPSLGKTWASVPAMEVVISRNFGLVAPHQPQSEVGFDKKTRWAKLVKMVNPPITISDVSPFQITADGVRDV